MITILRQFYIFIQEILYFFKLKSLKGLFGRMLCTLQRWYKDCCSELANVNGKVHNLVDTNIELGLYHFYKGNKEDAHLRFQLLRMCTSSVNALVYYNLGRCYFVKKKFKKANKYFSKALRIKESYPEVNYYLDKMRDVVSVIQVPLSIVEERFDCIAPFYVEDCIIQKHYTGYKIILYEIIDYLYTKGGESNILDVGCGTGICGHFLKMNRVGDSITGVDLSSKMLRIASRCYVNDKAVYDELIHMSSEKYFSDFNASEKFNIILAVDSLGYKKELYETFCLYRDALRKGGVIISIVRAVEDSSKEIEFSPELDMFCYSQDNMLQLSSKLNMETLKVIKCQLYDDISGYLCMFVKR